MSTEHILARLEELFEGVWTHPNALIRKAYTMSAFTRLAAAFTEVRDELSIVKSQLAAATAIPPGTSDADLDGLTKQIEELLGRPVADPAATQTLAHDNPPVA